MCVCMCVCLWHMAIWYVRVLVFDNTVNVRNAFGKHVGFVEGGDWYEIVGMVSR